MTAGELKKELANVPDDWPIEIEIEIECDCDGQREVYYYDPTGVMTFSNDRAFISTEKQVAK